MLSVWFADITGDIQVKGPSGFSTSFKQKGQPEVLRLQGTPVERLSDDDELCDMWLHPDNSSKLSVATPASGELSMNDPLEEQYVKLEDLMAQLTELRQQFHETEANIMTLIKAEFKSCTSLSCIWNTAKSKAPRICKLISAHFSHHSGRYSGCTDGDAQSPCRTQGQDGGQEGKPTQPTQVFETVEQEPTSVTSFIIPTPTASAVSEELEEHPEYDSDGLPEFSDGHDEYHSWFESTESSAHDALATLQDDATHMQDIIQRHLWLAVVSLLLLVVAGVVILRIVKICRDPRRRAERAARREELRTKRLYQKAACKHKWRTFWKQLRRQVTGDYEEKRAMILEQEGISPDSLQRHILTLRDATDLVRNLVAAEEGRAQADYRAAPARYQSSYQSPYSSSTYDAGVGSSRGTESLPSYAPPPPRYEEELEGEITVVDGFMYPASTTDDATESSIVDCSPRLSFETGRSTILTRDARD